MLGRILAIASDWQRGRTGHPQRSHRTTHELLMEGFVKEQHKRDLEDELEEASNGVLRALIVLKYKIKYIRVWYRTALRKDKLND